MSNLRYDQEYAQCPVCTRAFTVSVFGTDFCPYDRTLLRGVGKEYPSNVLKIGD